MNGAQDLRDTREHMNMCILGIPERKEREKEEGIFKKIVRNFPN